MSHRAFCESSEIRGAANRIESLIADADLRSRLGERARDAILARFAPEPALTVLVEEMRRLAP